MKVKRILSALFFVLSVTLSFSQVNTKTDSVKTQIEKKDIYRQHSIGSSLFVLVSYIMPDPADFYQLSYGYQFTRKDNLIVEAITWKYNEPLGTYESSKEFYPGKVRAYGIGVGYQRFHWKNSFTSVVATPFLQEFYEANNKKIQNGFQLYLQFILGYRFEFFKKRLFVEPAYALKYWPVNTNFPKSFADVEHGAPNYKFEPSLNFGFKF